MSLFTAYWPWWGGAFALAAVSVVYALWFGRSMGVSGLWAKLARWREYRAAERSASSMSEAELAEALLAATMEELGDDEPLADDSPAPPLEQSAEPPPSLTVGSAAVFLVMLAVGGVVGAMAGGRFEVRWDLGAAFARTLTADTLWTWLVLLAGGVLVGFGTTMSGGCTSGHGLSGCSRLEPASLIGTASFFGVGIATALLIGALS